MSYFYYAIYHRQWNDEGEHIGELTDGDAALKLVLDHCATDDGSCYLVYTNDPEYIEHLEIDGGSIYHVNDSLHIPVIPEFLNYLIKE